MKKNNEFIREALLTHLAVTLLTVLVFYYLRSPHDALSCFMGSLLIFINLIFILWSSQRIFQKNFIAIGVSVIVSKYAILGILAYILVTQFGLDPFSLLIGLGTLLPTVLVTSLQYMRKYA